jgi:hypothetical protein
VAVRGDGSFTLSLTKGRQYQIEFLNSAGQPVLVMPRKVGSLDSRFDVRGGGAPFDMGKVRYIGDAGHINVVFRAQTQSTPAAPDNVECEDGKDPQTGAICADEPDGQNNQQCGDNQQEGEQVDGTPPPPPPGSAAVADKNVPAAIGDCSDEGDDQESGASEKESR